MQPSSPQPVPQPFGTAPRMPGFSPEAMAQRSGGGMAKTVGVILLVLALLCLVNGIASVASGLSGGGIPPGSFRGMPPEAQAELERLTQEMIDRSLARWTFWANGGLELVLALTSLMAGIALLRGKMIGIKLTLARCAIAVCLFVPVYGYEGFAQMSEMSGFMRAITNQVQADIDRAEARRRAPPKPANAPATNAPASNTPAANAPAVQPPASATPGSPRSREGEEVAEMMEKLMRGFGYGAVVLFSFFVVIVNGVLALLVTRPKVRNYLEHAHEGGDVLPQFDAAMGLPMGPPPVGPGAPTVAMAPGALGTQSATGPGAPTVAIAPQGEPSKFRHLGASTRDPDAGS